MIAVDTSVLVRYVTQDDHDQSQRANSFFETELSERNPGYITHLALAEFHWVLRRKYGFPATQIGEAIRRLLNVPTLALERPDLVEIALAPEQGDFADRLIHFVAIDAGCERTVTFDRKFARLAGVELLKSE